MRFSFEVGGKKVTVHIEDAADPPPAAGGGTPAPPPLTDAQRAALAAAPGPSDRPVTLKELARRAGYSAKSNHFRELVNSLVDAGLLVRVRGGVRRSTAEVT